MKPFLYKLLPAILAGILLSWAFPRFQFHWLAWIALTPLFFVGTRSTPLPAAAYFFISGHLFYSLLLQWLVANIFWAGGWAIIGQQFLCAALALYWAVTGYLWAWAHQRSSKYAGALCLAALWSGMELLQARLFTGFGWGALGYTQGGNLQVAQLASIGGVTLISFVIVLVSALIALAVSSSDNRWKRIVAALLLIIAANGGGYLLLAESDYDSKPMTVGVIQPNFSQEMKWDPAYEIDMVQRTAQLSRALASRNLLDLLVWPEALVVRHYGNPTFMEILTDTAQSTNAHIFTGTVRDEYATGKSYNSSVLVTPGEAEPEYYDKVRLALFGEYIPFEEYLPFIGNIAFGGVSAGEKQKVFECRERVLGPIICFEVLFAPMAELLRTLGADMLVVVTNLAWFGGSNAIPQELEIARMRAIETRLPLVHSANTGVSGVFDPYGRFSVVRHTVGVRGDLVDWTDKVRPQHVMMRRFVEAFPLAAPGLRIIPYGPVFIPWLIAALGVLFFAIATLSSMIPTIEFVEEKGKPISKPKTKAKADDAPKRPRKKKTAAAKKEDEDDLET
jgi:apolipoprotein N-acyltransferase